MKGFEIMENKKLIESIIIIKGKLSETDYKKVFGEIKEQFEQFKIEKMEELGKKNLAYEVNKNKTGYYLDIEFYADSEDIKNLELFCRKNENILKWIFIRKD